MDILAKVTGQLRFIRDFLTSHRIVRAFSWTMSGHIAQQIIRLATNLVLARLLAPEMFGIMAAILAVQMILANLSDIGLHTSIIQSPRGEEPAFLHTVWTMQIVRGVAIWLITILVALSVSSAAGSGWFAPNSAWASADLPAAMIVLSFGAVIDGFSSTKGWVARRRMMYRHIVQIELIGQLLSVVVTLSVIRVTPNVWSLVIGGLAGTVARCVMTHVYLAGPRDRLAWNKEIAVEIVRFGSWLMLSSTATVLSMTIDRLLLGAIVPAATLGLYSIALGLVSIIELAGGKIMWDVMLPALSEAARAGHDAVRQRLYRARWPLDAGYLGAAGALYVLGPDIIQILYDARYHDAGRFLQILSFGLIFHRLIICNSAYIAMGHSRHHAVVMMVKVASSLMLTILGYYLFGIEGALWGIALHGIVTVPFNFYFNWKNDIAFWHLEVAVFAAWPVGYVMGLLLTRVI